MFNEEPDPDWKVRADADYEGYLEDIRLGRAGRAMRVYQKYAPVCHECGLRICACYKLNAEELKWEPTSIIESSTYGTPKRAMDEYIKEEV